MGKQVKWVRFSLAEASALRLAAGNVLEYPDAAASIFPNGAQRVAAVRAYDKLRDAPITSSPTVKALRPETIEEVSDA